MKRSGILLVFALVFVLSAACGSSSNGSKSNTSSSNDSTSSSDSSSTSSQVSGKIEVGGSTALQPLAAAAVDGFTQANPKATVDVQGGGSGTGLTQVASGAFDIGMSDKFAEAQDGIDASQLVDHKVAVVGMAAAINPAAGITNISKQDLIKVFTGKVTNWKEVGGKDQKIVLVNRPAGSGTLATFQQFALDNQTPATSSLTTDASNDVKTDIEQNPGAIGYLALSYFTDADKGKMTALSLDGVAPTAANIETGKYPVWAYEHMYTKGEATGVAKAFIDYIDSDEVQKGLVTQQGYLPVSDMKVVRDADGNVTKK
ncbi:phosphate ABC transporter substrate-binding protein [Pullulanibacillus sp. KACC 23026]|uniref:phosphate ABC transporter substrate-binding protein n=1 Tax=Pullulanibacillus sp. KACC 23026 TaxID=3028315 RepID=UPI0023AFF5A3|nr:phosphate ABC transporter substrate-binding protein [Pullulanibacillus sp. KACC 23026]WEG14922.1 phosphate ABC transporter substrate-binding protein [Pullulanibacillus sp. KACC 23026]